VQLLIAMTIFIAYNETTSLNSYNLIKLLRRIYVASSNAISRQVRASINSLLWLHHGRRLSL